MAAQIAAAIYNTGFKSPEKQVSPVDFMPSQRSKNAKEKSGPAPAVRMTKKKRRTLSRSLNAVLMQIARKA